MGEVGPGGEVRRAGGNGGKVGKGRGQKQAAVEGDGSGAGECGQPLHSAGNDGVLCGTGLGGRFRAGVMLYG